MQTGGTKNQTLTDPFFGQAGVNRDKNYGIMEDGRLQHDLTLKAVFPVYFSHSLLPIRPSELFGYTKFKTGHLAVNPCLRVAAV